MGDNDYSNIDVDNNIYIQSNFNLLNNSSSVIYNENNDRIYIGGMESYIKDKANINLLDEYQDISYKIILVHEGDYIDDILEVIPDTNMILAGHSLNGSVNVPFIKNIILPNGSKKYNKPYYKVNDTDIYISNGIGVDRINFRLFNTPSINFYRFNSK